MSNNMDKITNHFDQAIKKLSEENNKKMDELTKKLSEENMKDLTRMIMDLSVKVEELKNIVNAISAESPKKTTKKISATATKTSEGKKSQSSMATVTSTARVSIPSFFKSKCVGDKSFFDKYYALISDEQKEEINKKRNVKTAKSESEKTQAIAGHLYTLVKAQHGKEIEEIKKKEEGKPNDEPVKKEETSDTEQ